MQCVGEVLTGQTEQPEQELSSLLAETLRHLSAKYCPMVPLPSQLLQQHSVLMEEHLLLHLFPDSISGNFPAFDSCSVDHTVKIIDCQTGRCLRVRFHPLHPEIIASGSLDYEVRLWDANTSECIGSRDFDCRIASIAFHAKGDILAVASGHKIYYRLIANKSNSVQLYIWQYKKRGEASQPNFILKTRHLL
ncbi:activating molecule in becn1-regulated autophagy protein 1 [Quercus suber]|uniref:Activating molecule in becn1-regulated autophagy protein 1 n=1 Tax=Quercus suber TaxID=58331 RepID=A0AAW0JY27_QUESU